MGKLCVWYGTDQALRNLENAINRNCTCPQDDLTVKCPAHQMLVDQTVLNHFDFVDRRRMVYVKAEFDPTSEWF